MGGSVSVQDDLLASIAKLFWALPRCPFARRNHRVNLTRNSIDGSLTSTGKLTMGPVASTGAPEGICAEAGFA